MFFVCFLSLPLFWILKSLLYYVKNLNRATGLISFSNLNCNADMTSDNLLKNDINIGSFHLTFNCGK